MTTVKIDLPDQHAAALEVIAAKHGLTLEGWFKKLAAQEVPTARVRYSLSELIAQCDPEAPLSDDDRAWMEIPAIGREAL